MKKAQSAGAVVFFRGSDSVQFLLLKAHAKTDYWDFPKGAVEKEETPEIAAVREIREETGLSQVTFLPGFKHVIKYKYRWEGELIDKEVIFFLGESLTKDVVISHEHVGFGWFSFEDALKTVTFANQKQVLKKAQVFLEKGGLL